MIYILESKLPDDKSIYYALKYVYGIGNSKSFLICKKLGFLPNLKVKNVSSSQIIQLLKLVEFLNFVVANDLKRLTLLRTQVLISIKSYRGLRRKKGFPVRGQRTHTNAKTARKRL
jgi:small subunit ribosomal protein S13